MDAKDHESLPVNRCLGCNRPSIVLFCDNCAPPLRAIPRDSQSDRRLNGNDLGRPNHCKKEIR